MLVPISGEEIGKYWDIIKIALKSSALPGADTNEEKLANIQRSLLSGQACCWMEGSKDNPRTLVITTIAIEEISGTKNLSIYCAHGFQVAQSSDYVAMIKGIYKYAIAAECDNVIMYVGNPKLLALVKKYGAQTDYTLAVLPLR